MDYDALKLLIQSHPSWPDVSDENLTAWCNEEVVNVDKDSLPNEEILATILTNRTEFTALSATNQQIVRDILYVGDSVPTAPGTPARSALVAIFGVSSNTIQDLAVAITKTISRAASAGILGQVRVGDVQFARTL